MRAIYFLVFAIFAGGLSGCSKQTEYHQTLYAFGTEIHLQMLAENPTQSDRIVEQIEARFVVFNQDWHAWLETSTLSQINQSIKQSTPIEVTEEVKRFIVQSQQLSAESDGLFDPAIGQLVALWGFHSENWQGEPPAKSVIEQYLVNRATISQIQIKGNELSSTNPKVQLDFGGNVKGLALKQAAAIYRENGVKDGIINIGGDMLVLGSRDQKPWMIGVQNPKNPQKAIAVVEAKQGVAIVTSGTYQRFFEWRGKRYSHLLNPNTGYPAETFASVTVMHADPTRADAAATALLIAGEAGWQKVAKQMKIDRAFMIGQDGQHIVTESMKPFLKILD